MAGFCLKLLNELLREAVGEGGQRVRADHTGDLPVADGGILAHALLLQAGKGTRGRVGLFARSHTVNVEQAQLFQVGAVEIGMPCNGPQRVGALVAKGGCIRLRADAKAVQYDQKYTLFHMFSLHFPPGCPGTVALLLTFIISKSRRLCKRFVVESFLFKPDEILAVSLQRFFLRYCIQELIMYSGMVC